MYMWLLLDSGYGVTHSRVCSTVAPTDKFLLWSALSYR